MAFALVANVQTAGGTGGGTSAGINTAGANLIVVNVSGVENVNTFTISDSKGNTWTSAVDSGNVGIVNRSVIYYSLNPTVGSGHTFTVGGASTFSIADVAAFSGAAAASVLDVTNSHNDGSAGATTIQPGSVTPSQANSLVITGLSSEVTTTATITAGWNITNQNNIVGGVSYSVGLAYLIQTTATAVNPTWSGTATASGTTIAVFKPGTATAVTATPSASSLILTGVTPTFTAGSLLSPSAASLLLTGSATSVSVLAVLTPSAAALLMSGTTPAIVAGAVSSPTAAALLLAGATPVLVGLGTVSPTASSLRLTGATPLIGAGSLLVPSASGLILTGTTPSVVAGGVSALTLTPSAGHFILTGLTPPVFALAPKPGRTSSPTAYTPGDSPNLPGGDQRYLQTELGKISASLATVIRLLPQPSTVAPKGPLDGMQRLARAPWRPIAGVTTDAWVFYDAPSATWLLLHAN